MKMHKIIPKNKIKAVLRVPADKSISHRAIFISSIAKGKTLIKNFLYSHDTNASLDCMRRLGVEIKKKPTGEIVVSSGGKHFPRNRRVTLNAYNSGTTIRVISGILVCQNFDTILIAEGSLRKRPMKRITEPLRLMGADIRGRSLKNDEYPPLYIRHKSSIRGINYRLKVSSAQVKSAILFASLFAEGVTKIKEPNQSRDHTERMLKAFGASLKKEKGFIYSKKSDLQSPGSIFIPGDLSSASFFIALGAILDNSSIVIKNVGINPTRIGFINVLKRMGAHIKITNKIMYLEPYGDITVTSSKLKGVIVRREEIPLMIDELPLLFVCASFAKGTSIIYGLKELRVKETDRISSMVYNLRKAGIDIKSENHKGDWRVIIKGVGDNKDKIKPANFKSFSDHRTAMSMIVFGISSSKACGIDDVKCIDKSFPGFIKLINSLFKDKLVY